MKKEIRLTNLDMLEEVLNLDVDIISIGDEFCPWRLCHIKNYMGIVKKILSKNKRVRINTSFIPSKAMEQTLVIIKQLMSLSDDIEFVMNDYGILNYLKQNEMLPKNVIIGQMLNHSLEEYLWSNEVISEEAMKVRDNWLLSNFASKHVLNYFKDYYNVKGIIMNYLPYGQKSADIIKENGIEINFVDKYYTMAVARKCHSALYYNMQPGETCSEPCHKKLIISLEKTYTIENMDQKFISPETEVKEKVEGWIVYGNVIYYPYPENAQLDKMKYADDTIVINERYYENLDAIKKALNVY
ncbi:hypothetical protein NNC19_15470 [Clostridium sp. SHJSY1]|uniref:hypothetical protein n=1 Tax=Clostridium sp. SHJSY1 TaxID=2942483 RepID=UPI0028764BE5|nr:hypothetical protein [Clostridium sp. SHJSY1]MDS0527091.1 hypothetical protein [Clostridium sp. SHJSY1]